MSYSSFLKDIEEAKPQNTMEDYCLAKIKNEHERRLKLLKEECLKKMKEAQDNSDTESAHWDADNILCKFLKALGHKDLVEEYHQIAKWYA